MRQDDDTYTSLLVVWTFDAIDSGDIHLMGTRPAICRQSNTFNEWFQGSPLWNRLPKYL